jgi:hypothetical protein
MRLKLNRDKVIPAIISIGIIAFIIHNPRQPLKEYLFLPTVGLMLILLGVSLVVLRKGFKPELGSKWVWIPMLVIIGSAAVRIAIQPTMKSVADTLFLVLMFALYLTARQYRVQLFRFIPLAIIIETGSLILYGITGTRSGGIISPANYDIATGFLVLGALVSMSKQQWIIVTIAMIGLFFTGSEEAILAVGIVGIAILVRRDWSKKLLLPVGLLVIITIIGLAGYTPELYKGTVSKAASLVNPQSELIHQDEVARYPDSINYIFNNRVRVIQQALSNIKPLGNGLNLTDFTFWTPHNVPIIIVDQLGILAGIAWLVVTVYCVIKTKWKYAWIGLIALCLFDHFIWTQAAPYWWVLVGASTASPLAKDWIFRSKDESSSGNTLS